MPINKSRFSFGRLKAVMGHKNASVLVITSHVVRGRIGARACVFALERLGHPTWMVPTITLPWHPGHGQASRLVASADDFTALIDDLKRSAWLSELGGMITGYIGAAHQAKPIAGLIEAARAANPDFLYCCDPVIGDEAGLYVPEETAGAIRDQLLPLADLITPNRFEFDWLTGKTHEINEDIVATAKTLSQAQVAVTSAFAMMKQSQGTLLWDRNSGSAFLAEHRSFENAPNGPGDLFCGLLTARLLQGMSPEKALQVATAGVFDILAQTVKAGADELVLVEEQSRLERPMAMVNLRRIGGPVITRKGVVAKPRPLV